jgi:hypothetical protein
VAPKEPALQKGETVTSSTATSPKPLLPRTPLNRTRTSVLALMLDEICFCFQLLSLLLESCQESQTLVQGVHDPEAAGVSISTDRDPMPDP